MGLMLLAILALVGWGMFYRERGRRAEAQLIREEGYVRAGGLHERIRRAADKLSEAMDILTWRGQS
jgi:hypothetical protein